MVSRHSKAERSKRGLGQTKSILWVEAHSLGIVEHLNVETNDQTRKTGRNRAVKGIVTQMRPSGRGNDLQGTEQENQDHRDLLLPGHMQTPYLLMVSTGLGNCTFSPKHTKGSGWKKMQRSRAMSVTGLATSTALFDMQLLPKACRTPQL